jgi:FkbM family methyltransferase
MIRYLREVNRWHFQRRLLSLSVRPDPSLRSLPSFKIQGAVLPEGMIKADWICYSGGVGENIEIDLYLTEQVGCHVWAFDPTPRSIAYMERTEYDRTRLHFIAVGLWDSDKTLRFNAPANPEWVSHSIVDSLGGDSYFDAPCKSVPDLMREIGHRKLDLLKLNIEGAEDVVLKATLDAGIRPEIIVLTYEGPGAFGKARFWTKILRQCGYALLARSGWWFTYIRPGARLKTADYQS